MAISKWERGESVPDITVLKQIADMFEVTVDYLLSATHDDKTELPKVSKRIIKRNQLIITLLATAVVWLLASITFVLYGLITDTFQKVWLAYIVAIPVSLTVLLVFNSIWGKRVLLFPIVSAFLWTTLLTICLCINFDKIWFLFVIGIPAQIMILISAGFKFRKN